MSFQLSKYRVEKLAKFSDIFPGYAFESEKFTDNPSDIALVKGENVQQGYIDWSISKFWPKYLVGGLEKYNLKAGDIVLAMDRPWVISGLKWAYLKKHDPQSMLVQRVASVMSNLKCRNNMLLFVHTQPRRFDYEQIHCDTHSRRT